jgi:intracellular sulfur oxidation DsrE/DsrF family protein
MMLRSLLMLLCLLAAGPVLAEVSVDELLARDDAPEGVVFELIGSEDALPDLIPQVRRGIDALRARWPGLEIAIVSHGSEQFALMRGEAAVYAEMHQAVQQLVREEGVPVHVCGTHAEWRGVTAEQFPEYVDVAAAGPAQINDYRALGYALVVVSD